MMEDKEEDEMEMDFSHSSVLGKYSETVEQAEKIVEVWLDKVRKGKLTPANFKEHWRVWVPKNYTVVPGSDLNLENEKSNDVLIDNLERFLANGGDFEEAMKKLNDLDNPPSVCGRVFKVGTLCLCLIHITENNDLLNGIIDFRWVNLIIHAGNVEWTRHVCCVLLVSSTLLIKITIIKWGLAQEGDVVIVEMLKPGRMKNFVIFIYLELRSDSTHDFGKHF